IGRPLDVYHRPASTFVASFIGSPAMNLIQGRIEGSRLSVGTYRIELGDRAPVEGPVTVGLRAEDLRLAGVGEDAMLFQVDYVEELGAQRLVHGTIEDQALTVALSPEIPLSGDLAVTIATDRLHFFSTENGKRLERGASLANMGESARPLSLEPAL
ncbi:MAG: sn-glycerol-3-phosphate ABC transporter ATP-binding protein UgpC, partial [Ensifer adhaerens]